MERVAIIFDNQQRPETTGLYCRRALGTLATQGIIQSVEHILPSEIERVAPGQFDLFLYVDDGLQQAIRPDLRPAVWWCIDTHVGFERCLGVAAQADLTFAAQRDGAQRLTQEGIPTATWLPLACDPEIHGRRDVATQYDIAFVGHIFPGERQRLLELIAQQYPRTFIGNRYFEEMAETYSASKIVFNRSIANDINMRVFEGLCSGSLLLTNDLTGNGLNELIQDGQHCATYNSDEELFDKLEYYLNNDAAREKIAQAGRDLVCQQHTYMHRMQHILEGVTEQYSAKSSSVPRPNKDRFYFEWDRHDVLELVPASANRILDVGCGAGKLGWNLKQRQQCHVTGIERDPGAASVASERLDEVVVTDLMQGDVDFAEATFDCVICADVLEHLRFPERVLTKIRRWLKPDGHLVTSLPNVRNHSVVRSLLAGNWTYEPAGLLDEDHVRFFTKREIEKLLFQNGFAVDQMHVVGGDGYREWVQQGRPRQIEMGPFQLRVASEAEAEEFFAYQFLTRSTVAPQRDLGLTSIVLVTHNQWTYTKDCLESIRQRTTVPCEIIVVDNASTDATIDYLSSSDDVQLIQNSENRGFPAAANQGIEAATGSQILLLNNDTIVTTGWLRRMLDALDAQPSLGLVGPLSNNISGPQQIEVSYDDLAQLDGFAWELAKHNHRNYLPTDRLVGFCLLFKREVVDKIGLLDERFGVGNFEDDDFCRRAQTSGFGCAIVADSFVHHFGSVTFKATQTDLHGLLQQNQQAYEEKWRDQASQPVAVVNDHNAGNRNPRPKFLFDLNEDSSLLLKENHVHLSACLIVRDNETTIRPCLESLTPWVDEVVVVDTGSKDTTPQICEELGARVYHWPWCDDFAAARNESLKYAFGEWIFWMDSDDTLPPDCGQQLRDLANGEHSDHVMGYVMQVHCPGQTSTDVTVVDHIKLFRNRPDIHFEFRIHEQVIPSIRRAGGDVAWTDLFVVHSGSDHSDAGRSRKLERDFHLLELELSEHPQHPFVLFNLGMTYADGGQFLSAIDYLRQCIHVSSPQESHVRKAYALLVSSLSQVERCEEAWASVTEALKWFEDDKELLFREGMLHHHFGRLQAAVHSYRRVLQQPSDRHFASVDSGIAGFKARHNLAIVYELLQQPDLAIEQWKSILTDHPDYLPAWRGWGNVLVAHNRREDLNAFYEEFPQAEDWEALKSYLQGKVALESGDLELARERLEAAHAKSPKDTIILNETCRLLFEHFDPVEAIHHLRELVALDAEDASSWHNLGVAMMNAQEWEQAEQCFQTSLELRPDSPTTGKFLHDVTDALQHRHQTEAIESS